MMDSPLLDQAVIAELRGLSTPDDNLFADVVGVFAADAPAQLAAIDAAIAAGDAAAVQRAAHRLKGSARGIGARQLGDAAAAVEAAARAGDLGTARAAAAALGGRFDAARAALARELA